jgi:hypothetical protein
VKWVLAKSIIEKLPRIAPLSPTTAIPKNFCMGPVSCFVMLGIFEFEVLLRYY